ncbi:MAG: Ig-like domain-containing protein [Actinomycetota bacterium]|nr:Ig-like domain-containing protein [Actinomycetota bacterium]
MAGAGAEDPEEAVHAADAPGPSVTPLFLRTEVQSSASTRSLALQGSSHPRRGAEMLNTDDRPNRAPAVLPAVLPAAVAALLLALALFALAGGAGLAAASEETGGAGSFEAGKQPPPVADTTEGPQSGTGQAALTTAAAAPQWNMGPFSRTYYFNPTFGTTEVLTMDSVGYWGATDGSYPRVGDTYYGVIRVGSVNSFGAKVVPEVRLPPNTQFDLDPNDPNKRIYCYYQDNATGQTTEITGTDCTQTPKAGLAGTGFWAFSGPQSTNWLWPVPGGKNLQIVFPIKSTAPLEGIASTGDCLQGAVWADAAIGNWDKPDPWDQCPLPQDHGAYQWVNVSPAPDTKPPTVKSVSPAAGATGVAPAANVRAVFSEPVQAGTVNTTNVRLRRAGTTKNVAATVAYDASTKRAVLNPNANLASGATYIATVTSAVRDKAGNQLDQNASLAGNQAKVWKFRVK